MKMTVRKNLERKDVNMFLDRKRLLCDIGLYESMIDDDLLVLELVYPMS